MIGTTTHLEVSTLGRFEIQRQNDQLSGGNWNRRKVSDLFKMLLSAEQHRLHREQIQEILWPTSSSDQAANSFGKTLYLLRRALEPELTAGKGSSSIYILLDHDSLMLLPEHFKIDADLFEAKAKELRMKLHRGQGPQKQADTLSELSALLDEFDNVLSLYRGDYLPEDLYEDWAQRRRDRLRRLHSWLLENAAELAITLGALAGQSGMEAFSFGDWSSTPAHYGQRACEYLQALLERDSIDEQTHRQLMLVYARMGKRSEALNQYLLLRQALREELHTRPLAETEELLRNIQSGKIAVDLGEAKPTTTATAMVKAAEQRPVGASHETKQSQRVMAGARTSPPHAASVVDSSTLPPLSQQPPNQIDPDRILKAELVGREEQLNRLQQAYTQACNGKRRAIFISGEPGIGKTRLAQDFTRWAEDTGTTYAPATVLWGYCYEMSGLLPYQPIAEAIAAHVRTCTPEQLRSILGNSAVDLAKIVPDIRLKLPDLPQPELLGPEAERRNLFVAVARYMHTLAAERPLIVILDDLQWADAATLQILNFLLSQGAGSSSHSTGVINQVPTPLYLMLYRVGEVHETHPLRALIATLSRGGVGEEIRLQRLNEEQVHQLLENMAGHGVSATFVSEIYRQTEGNPFFVGEAIRSLIFEGKLVWTGERWQATVKLDELEIPQSVRLLIERRLVQLSPECRTTLTLAAVLGRQFSSGLLCQARNLSENAVAEHIDLAISTQILSPVSDISGTPQGDRKAPLHPIPLSSPLQDEPLRAPMGRQDVDLAFTHDKIREVLYQWLNPLRRRTLHRQVVQAIEARYAEHLQRYYNTLAYHCQMAEDTSRAVDYLLKAAEHAISVYAYVDAAGNMNDALEFLIGEEEHARRAEVLYQLSNTGIYTGRLDEAVKAGLASCALWRDLGEVAKLAEAQLHVAFLCLWTGHISESVKHIQQALQSLEAKPAGVAAPQSIAGLRARAYAQWAMAATILGDTPRAQTALQQARNVGGGRASNPDLQEEDPFITVFSLWSMCWYAFLAESPAQMLEHALHAAEFCHTAHKPSWEPMMRYSAAWAYMLLGRLDDGHRLAQEALKQATQFGVVTVRGWAYLVSAFLAIQAGNWEDAERAADNANAVATMLHNADLEARVLWSRSVCAGWEGDWERAISHITQAMQVAQEGGETSMIFPHLLIQLAKAHIFAGKPEEAQYYLDQGMQLAQSRKYRQLPAIGQRLQGRILQAQGRFEEAQLYFERSLAELAAIDDVVEYTRTQEAYGLFHLARNQGDDAEHGQALLDSARATFMRLGMNG